MQRFHILYTTVILTKIRTIHSYTISIYNNLCVSFLTNVTLILKQIQVKLIQCMKSSQYVYELKRNIKTKAYIELINFLLK